MEATPANPEYSFILPTTRPAQVRQAIDSILNHEFQGAGIEVIVVTPQPQADLLQYPGVRVVGSEKLFAPGRMRNLGANIAKGSNFVFLDDDCVLTPGWLARVHRVLQTRPDVGAIGTRVEARPGTAGQRCGDYCLFLATQFRVSESRHFGAAAVAVRREVFDRIAGFDEELLASEDWDFCLKVEEAGWKCWYEADAVAAHHHDRDNLKAIFTGAYRTGYRAGLTVQSRHASRMTLPARCALAAARMRLYALVIVPYAMMMTTAFTLVFVLRQPETAGYLPFYFASQLCNHIGVCRRLHDDRIKPPGIARGIST